MTDHIDRLRAFKFYFDKGSAVASDEARDAMKLLDDYDALASRLAEAELDAARYRWLRGTRPDSVRWMRWNVEAWNKGAWVPLAGEDLDAAVDAALLADQPSADDHAENCDWWDGFTCNCKTDKGTAESESV